MAVSGRLAALAAAAVLALHASAAGSGPKPAPKHPGRDVATWAQGADAVCNRAKGERRALLESARAQSERSRTTVLELVAGSAGISGRMLARLTALPRPPEQRQIIALTLATLRREYRADLALLARLRKRWRSADVERRLERDRALNAQLRLLFLGLESKHCAGYFSDPPAYAP